MNLLPDWRYVLRHAWSVRLMIVAGLLSGLEAALPIAGGLLPIPTGTLAIASFVVVCAAFIARIVAQKSYGEKNEKQN